MSSSSSPLPSLDKPAPSSSSAYPALQRDTLSDLRRRPAQPHSPVAHVLPRELLLTCTARESVREGGVLGRRESAPVGRRPLGRRERVVEVLHLKGRRSGRVDWCRRRLLLLQGNEGRISSRARERGTERGEERARRTCSGSRGYGPKRKPLHRSMTGLLPASSRTAQLVESCMRNCGRASARGGRKVDSVDADEDKRAQSRYRERART